MPTRWNSTFYVFKRFHDLQDAVKTSVALIDKGLPILSADDWRNCREICDVLAPFEDTTKNISGEQYTIGSQVIGLTRGLVSIFGKMVNDTKFHSVAKNRIVNIQQGILERFVNLEFNKTVALATFLDPRFKLYAFTNQNASDSIKKFVIQKVTKGINKSKHLREVEQVEEAIKDTEAIKQKVHILRFGMNL